MKSWRAFLETVNLLALAIWLGTVVVAPVCVVRVFMTMEKLSPRLDAYAQYGGEHWRLAAGQVGNGVFLITDIIQFVAALLAGLSFAGLVVIRAANPRRRSTWVRGLGLSVAMASLMGMMLIVVPSLNARFRKYWDAAAAGKTEVAQHWQAEAAKLHPTSEKLVGLTAVAVLASLTAGAWSLAKSAGDAGDDRADMFQGREGSTPGPRAAYPEPALLRRKARP